MKNFSPQKLPSKRTNNILGLLNRTSIVGLVLYSIFFYILLALIFSIVETIALSVFGIYLLYDNNVPITSFVNILYFNFVTILTIGYGDIVPVGLGRIISIIEAIMGMAVFTSLVAIITTKILLPAKDTIVFSEYAYYCTDQQRFLIIFVNTSKSNLVNVEISSYFKLGGDWVVSPSIVSPFITQSVQTFFINIHTIEELKKKLQNRDCLRVGIAGDIGFARFSTSIEYPSYKILVIPNRDELIYFQEFHNPDFSSDKFIDKFNYRPFDCYTLEEYKAIEREK